MATFTAANNGYTLELVVTPGTQSAVNNTTALAYTLTLKAGGNYYSLWETSWEVYIDGTRVAYNAGEQISIAQYGSKQLASGSATVTHATDGSKKGMAVSFKISTSTSQSYLPGTISGSGTMDLATIPRASTIGATDANIGAVSMIAVDKKSSAYTHSIAYKFGSLTGYLTSAGGVSAAEVKFSASSVAFTVPTAFYAQIPNAPSGICTLTIKTYSGSTQIGAAQTCTFTATASKASCAPAVSGTVVDSNAATKALTGDAAKLVRYCSTALCTLTAVPKNSALIYERKIGGEAITGSNTTRSIANVESGSVVFYAKDSRGYETSVTVNASMVDYIKLTSNASGKRTDPTSGNATLTIKGNYFNGSFGAAANTLSVKYRIAQVGGTYGDYITVTPTISGNTYSVSVPLSGLDYEHAYNVEVVVADKLSAVTSVAVIKQGIPVFDWGKNDFRFNVPVDLGSNRITGLGTPTQDSDAVSKLFFETARFWGIHTIIRADANSMVSPGIYRVDPSTSANYPTAISGIMLVFACSSSLENSDSATFQLLAPYTGEIYARIRWYSTGGWRPWVKVTTTAV